MLTDQPLLKTLVETFRDWGRDCWCEPGHATIPAANASTGKLGDLPCGYDHKYTYSHIGYNLKATDMQAAVGVAQLQKLAGFIEARRRNFELLREGLRDLEEFFILPEATAGSQTRAGSASRIAVREDAPFTRNQVIAVPGGAQDRDATAVRRQPGPPAGLPRQRVPRRRKPEKYGLRDEPGVLDRRVSRDRPGNARLHAGEPARSVPAGSDPKCNPLAPDLDHVLAHTAGVWDELRGARIFVTGGTGFFGCWLLESLAWAWERLRPGRASLTVLTRSADAFRRKAPHLAAHPANSPDRRRRPIIPASGRHASRT